MRGCEALAEAFQVRVEFHPEGDQQDQHARYGKQHVRLHLLNTPEIAEIGASPVPENISKAMIRSTGSLRTPSWQSSLR